VVFAVSAVTSAGCGTAAPRPGGPVAGEPLV